MIEMTVLSESKNAADLALCLHRNIFFLSSLQIFLIKSFSSAVLRFH